MAQHGHVGRAAIALGLAQPSLSYQISRLESDLGGVPLFVRGGKGMTLTAAGQALRAEVTPLLRRVEGLPEVVANAAAGQTGILRIGVVHGAILSGVASRVIRDFRRRYPQVTLRVQSMLHVPLVRLLQNGELDLAVFGSPLGDPELIGVELARENFLLALPTGHRLTQKKTVHYRELNGEPLIAMAREFAPALFANVLDTCARHGAAPSSIEEAAGEDAVVGLVAAGLGIAVIPGSWRAFGIPGYVTRPLRPAGAGATLRLFRHAANDSPVVRNFLECATRKPAASSGSPGSRTRQTKVPRV